MKVKSVLEEASLESITTAEETALGASDKSTGRTYFNRDTDEILVCNNGDIIRYRERTAVGELKTSFLDLVDYQNEMGPTWISCDGSIVNNTNYSELIKKSSGLKGEFKVLSDGGILSTIYYAEANNTNTNRATIPFDGIATLDATVNAWNISNPADAITLYFHNPAFVPAVTETIEIDAYIPDMRGMFIRGFGSHARTDQYKQPVLNLFKDLNNYYDVGGSRSSSEKNGIEIITTSQFGGLGAVTPRIMHTLQDTAVFDNTFTDANPTLNTESGNESAPNAVYANYYIKINR